jgi:site-specific DNA-cytosine methylase
MTLRMLAACEMSGRVRSAFAARGWDAWSADLLPDESGNWNDSPGGAHYQGDVFNIIREDWDLVVAFPPCTDLTQAGARFWKQKQADGRQQAAARFFMQMYVCPSPSAYVAVENPRGWMTRAFREPDQIVEPWWFGDPFAKKTCLWLRPDNFRLPLLVKQNEVVPTGRVTTGGGSWRTDQANGKVNMNNWEDSQGRARRHILRSLTMPKFAQAMADQWGEYIERQRG